MTDKKIKKASHNIVPLAMVLLALFWVGDAVFDAHLIGEGTLHQQLFRPELRELAMRALFALFFLAFAFYVKKVMVQRDALEAALQSAVDEAEAEKERTIAIVSAMGDGISIQDTDLRVTYQNDAHKALVGDHVGDYCYRAYQLKDEPCDYCDLVKSFRDGKVYRRESSPAISHGKINVEIISSSLRDKSGRVIAGIEMVRDITKRKQAEAALESQANLLQRLIDTIPSPIFYKDAKGVFLGCNEAFTRCSGIVKMDVIGKTAAQILPAELAAAQQCMEQQLLAEPGVQAIETTIPCADSGPRQVILNNATFTDADGNVAGMVGIVIDITQLMESEKQIKKLNEELSAHAAELAAANKELEAFSYSVSHDLRTPLTRIFSAGQALEEDYLELLDENGRFFLQTITDGCQQMEELIEALLKLSQATKAEIKREEVDLSKLVMEVLTDLKLAEPGRQVVFQVPPQIMAGCDPELARVVLENLIGNAWKYTGKRTDACIEFGVMEEGERKTYFIRDNGAGFDMKKAGSLFKPFQRLHSRYEFPGTGIGLATVERIIKHHGGRIWGEGEPGKGATFYFTFS
ncbi:PAS domain-containing sensor histidine kinase [Geotalea sp. SG265]|uniref:PAS domain-containing sensor histidine kinase n=1 Tax=Geotalea sp. SG265 TaxID=2922867 RepID=UPI001FAE7954|nr:PAS domain-containing sensor histidine kinase [Geotalea sp. SG265]